MLGLHGMCNMLLLSPVPWNQVRWICSFQKSTLLNITGELRVHFQHSRKPSLCFTVREGTRLTWELRALICSHSASTCLRVICCNSRLLQCQQCRPPPCLLGGLLPTPAHVREGSQPQMPVIWETPSRCHICQASSWFGRKQSLCLLLPYLHPQKIYYLKFLTPNS